MTFYDYCLYDTSFVMWFYTFTEPSRYLRFYTRVISFKVSTILFEKTKHCWTTLYTALYWPRAITESLGVPLFVNILNACSDSESKNLCEVNVVIRFLSAKGMKAAEIHLDISEVYGENIISNGMVRRW